jgi:hypothetical protein
VPEFFIGLYFADWFLHWLPGWRRSVPTIFLAGLVFIATGAYGLLFRYLLFGEITPSFISFAFGVNLLRAGEHQS